MVCSRPRVFGSLTFVLVVLCLLWPTSASANGAMSLALATFLWGPWLVYVAVTVLFEALAMGKWLQVPFFHALKCSLIANFVTAIIGGFFSGIISYAFLGMFGSRIDPNPFGQTLTVFTLFGIGSALIESFFWNAEAQFLPPTPNRETIPPSHSKISPITVLLRCLGVHLVGVPLGLAVLLFPSRPYPGIEGQVSSHRSFIAGAGVNRNIRALNVYISAHGALPSVHSYGELLQHLRPYLDRNAEDPGLWAAAYLPEYQRFDTREMRRHPIEWNTEASGRKLFEDTKQTQKTIWLTRVQRKDGFYFGWILDTTDGHIHTSGDPIELGYKP